MLLLPHPYTLIPYTTLFRSVKLPFYFQTIAARATVRSLLIVVGGSEDENTKLPATSTSALACMSSFELASFTPPDRKSTRLNSSHVEISYAVFCLKKKIKKYRCLPRFVLVGPLLSFPALLQHLLILGV